MLARGNHMSITVNGQSRVPPGFRFHPTEEELLNYYLRKKVAGEKIDLDVIRDVDLNKLEPWDIQEKCRIGSTPQNDWYFFSHKDKKYPTGTRTNRATAAGFWKATGRDKVIYTNCKRIGMRKTLVFYRGRAPHGQKSDWIMHEYRLDEQQDASTQSVCSSTLGEASAPEDGWVVCRVFKKKNHNKAQGSPNNSSSVTSAKTQMLHSCGDGALDQILQYLGRSCKQENDANGAVNPTLSNTITTNTDCHLRYLRPSEATVVNGHQERFMKLPPLESPSLPPFLGDCPPHVDQPCSSQSSYPSDGLHALLNSEKPYTQLPHEDYAAVNDWAALDRLVASHLSVQSETSKQLASCFEEQGSFGACCSATNSLLGCSGSCQDYQEGDMDLWAFARSASSSGTPDPSRPCAGGACLTPKRRPP